MRFPLPAEIPQSQPLRWGIAGAGDIAGVFATAVATYGTQEIVAVASRSASRAQLFASTHNISQHSGSYEELVNRDDIDVVYVANHIGGHLDLAELALEHGKHVLVEKPLDYRADRASELLAFARQRGLLITEAMWTRYLPQTSVIKQIIESEEFGVPEHVIASFAVDNQGIDRLWAPGTGGITYDMGIYPIAFAHNVLGEPSSIEASGTVTQTGIDREATVLLSYPSGATASLVISGVATFPSQASVSGTNLSLTVDHPFFVPTTLRVSDKSLYSASSSWNDETGIHGHDGLHYQAEWFAHYVEQGLIESPLHKHAEIVSNLAVAERICQLIGANPGTQTT